ncbi:hypothetical protein L228DRAFT_284407 [Xylona heveae TC161]|uniref:Conserved oligomeric Golgi complex subunit 1 n=1 Tax=Xylona heveae (strain CBS 132557 / TC161) TaxID=1328760 RepID=A0A165FTL3_XYLHT|nr:hypothetical protein L228DRAFT_284407 [Xylona heveae TC161]KZF21361.1 hypothetical protein L228DRAFT_284407 [Xylona heveae TC161]
MVLEAPDPKTFSSWEDAFRYPTPAVRHMELQLRGDLGATREKLRGMVGASYRDLLGTAENIIEMDQQMHNVERHFGDITRKCDSRSFSRLGKNYGKWNATVKTDDRNRYALTSQLALLQSFPGLISQMLRQGDSILLAAKLLVLSRLLHKSLSNENNTPPLADTLRNRLASLRRSILSRIDRQLSSLTASTTSIVESMCAFSLATSSTPTDVLRHFQHIRLRGISARLELDSQGRADVLGALSLFIRTLEDVQTIMPSRLADTLKKIKSQPILSSPDVESLLELNLDIHGKWVAEEVKNFVPWIRHDDLKEDQAKAIQREWSKKAFGVFLDGLKTAAAGRKDLKSLVEMRQEVLSNWLRNRTRVPGLGGLSLLESLRAALNDQLTHLVRLRASRLHLVQTEISAILADGPTALSSCPSLWDESMITMDFSNGAVAFKQAILDRSSGRSDAVLRVLRSYESWLSLVDEARIMIKKLRDIRWDDDLDLYAATEDEFESDAIQSLLSDEDPTVFETALTQSLQTAFGEFEKSIDAAVTSLLTTTTSTANNSDPKGQQTIFIIRIVRELRHKTLAHADYSSESFATPVIISRLLTSLAQTTIGTTTLRPLHRFAKKATTNPRELLLQSQILWEGSASPPQSLPVQPSPEIFKVLHRLSTSMASLGGDLWNPAASSVLKQSVSRRVEEILGPVVDELAVVSASQGTSVERTTGVSRQDRAERSEETEGSRVLSSPVAPESNEARSSTEKPEKPETPNSTVQTNGTLHPDDITLRKELLKQVLFDVTYLQRALTPSSPSLSLSPSPLSPSPLSPSSSPSSSSPPPDIPPHSLEALADKINNHIQLPDSAKERLHKSAQEYWKRTALLFGLLS